MFIFNIEEPHCQDFRTGTHTLPSLVTMSLFPPFLFLSLAAAVCHTMGIREISPSEQDWLRSAGLIVPHRRPEFDAFPLRFRPIGPDLWRTNLETCFIGFVVFKRTSVTLKNWRLFQFHCSLSRFSGVHSTLQVALPQKTASRRISKLSKLLNFLDISRIPLRFWLFKLGRKSGSRVFSSE